MNLNKMYGYFDPTQYEDRFVVIGCGAIGSHVAEILTRLGIKHITLYDFDFVTEHNITNQLYTAEDVNKLKTEALANYLKKINPDLKLIVKGKYTDQPLSGHVILAVDSVDVRKEIINNNITNIYIKTWTDFRMGLTEAQAYLYTDPKNLLKTLDFTHEEAMQNTPVSPCGTTLNVNTTVKCITALGIQNLINHLLKKPNKHIVTIDLNKLDILTI